MIETAQTVKCAEVAEAAEAMIGYGEAFYAKSWNLATSSNYSAVVNRNPLHLLMTASGTHKGALTASDFVVVDENLHLVDFAGYSTASGLKPSAEAALHLELARLPNVMAVLHTHSVWSTILSDRFFEQGAVKLSGYEMLKALSGIKTHDTTVSIPILENSQDIRALAQDVRKRIEAGQITHAFLLRGHGLYTWAVSQEEARNQIEALEFLFEVVGRKNSK